MIYVFTERDTVNPDCWARVHNDKAVVLYQKQNGYWYLARHEGYFNGWQDVPTPKNWVVA